MLALGRGDVWTGTGALARRRRIDLRVESGRRSDAAKQRFQKVYQEGGARRAQGGDEIGAKPGAESCAAVGGKGGGG